MYLVTAKEMQAMDAATIDKFGLPGRVLMENAGRGATQIFLETIYSHTPDARVAVMAGRGNNGGDGFVIARYLAQKKIPVSVYLLSTKERVTGDAAANLSLLAPMGITVQEVNDSDAFAALKPVLLHQQIWIDAILGTGLSSDVKGFYQEVIDFINSSNRPVFSVDIPSGLNSDTGQPCGTCIRATATATFAFAKLGHMLFPGATYTGDLGIVEIGIPPHIAAFIGARQHLLTKRMLQNKIINRSPDSHKGRTGHVLVVAGSTGKTGAAAMTTMSALKSGAGLVTLAAAKSLNTTLEPQVLEAMTFPLPEDAPGSLGPNALPTILELCRNKRCMALGPGLGTNTATQKLTHSLIRETPIPVVIDADGLNHLSYNIDGLRNVKVPLVLTPHPGEMSRLINESVASIQKDRIGHARKFAQTHGVYLVLKGARTVIAYPDGNIFINPTGNSGMASGGMGDVLTGIIAGFIAQGYDPGLAACLGTYLHGAAADTLAQAGLPIGYLAGQVMDQIPKELGQWIIPQQPARLREDPLGYET